MDWTAAVDAYCERTGPEFWAEPVNALTNAAFLLGAAAVWRRTAGLPVARGLAVILVLIGIGSFLFHTHATRWAGMADVLPILAFILLYVFAASRDMLGLSVPWSLAATAAFVPYAALTVPLFAMIPGLGSSAGYAPVPLLILVYAAILHRREPAAARGLAIGAGILIVSLTFRTLDEPLCAAIPAGTHFLWHCLNALMLAWMISVYCAHVLGKRAAGD
jgi:hypothetical protein